MERTAPKIGLVLGAGGITGIAWLAGVAAALREQTGWNPADADLLAGTSAGAIVATLLAAREDPEDLLRYAEVPGALDAAIAEATAGRARDAPALPLPGSLALTLRGLVTTHPRDRIASLAGLLPRGMRSNAEIRAITHRAAAHGWPRHTALWLHACDIATGRLVTFGRAGAPAAPLSEAVVASCAVPSYYRPVRIGAHTYVDGGLRSLTNADQLVDEGCDSVVICSPFSSDRRGALLDTAIYGAARATTAYRVQREARALRAAGAQVAVIQPTTADIRAMGLNPMDRDRSRRVLEAARESTMRRVDELLGDVALPAASRRKLRAA